MKSISASTKSAIRTALVYTLALLPFALIGGWCTGIYSFNDLYDEATRQAILAQLGSLDEFCLAVSVQYLVYTAFCGFTGFLLAKAVGLFRPFGFERRATTAALALSVACGALFALDRPVFGRLIPGVAALYEGGLSAANLLASVLLGGIVEEVMLRLFLMSLLALLFWKLFFRSRNRAEIPEGVFVAANIVSALAFAAGHLPATVSTFGGLTPLLVFRCFLLNGAFGLAFGWLYRRYGIWYAMLGHITVHVVSKLFWLAFI